MLQVTDSRDPPTNPRPPARRNQTGPVNSTPTSPSAIRNVSVDSVLRGTSEIPSGQTRTNALSYLHRARAAPMRAAPPRAVDPRRIVNRTQLLPSRSSKVSEKLVLIPETADDVDTAPDHPRWDYTEDYEDGPPRDDEGSPEEADEETTSRLPPRKSYAERLPKSRRAEKFSRVTAYCTADAYRLKSASKFLKEVHGARTKLYDECLYVAYHLPLLTGGEGYRLRSSPALKNPGGKPVLDVEIERSEQRNYHEGYFDTYHRGPHGEDGEAGTPANEGTPVGDVDVRPESPKEHQSAMDMKSVAEMFVFSYGVVVFWNFSERQEKDILADLTFAPGKLSPLISGPMKEEDFESEEFHFEYSSKTRSPRVRRLFHVVFHADDLDLQRHDHPALRRHHDQARYFARNRAVDKALSLRRVYEHDHVGRRAHSQKARAHGHAWNEARGGHQDDGAAVPAARRR